MFKNKTSAGQLFGLIVTLFGQIFIKKVELLIQHCDSLLLKRVWPLTEMAIALELNEIFFTKLGTLTYWAQFEVKPTK